MGATLSFRLKFTEGLKAMGAKYYRVSVAEADSSGNPIGIPQPLMNDVTWRKWILVGGQIQTQPVTLGPNSLLVDGNVESGLYIIPYEADAAPYGWLWFYYHQSWTTPMHVNKKYLAIVEIFDAAGKKLKPSTSPPSDPGIAKPFKFRRWIDETNTIPVSFAALAHMFHVNNKKCYGDIVDFRKNHVPSIEECQYIVECESDAFSVGFFAFHEDNFMQSYHLWHHRGLNGPDITLETGMTNAPPSIPPVPATLDSSNAKDSNSRTFDQMLESHDKCAFSIELRVYPKHTDGFGIIWDYGDSDTAAVSLEKVECIPLASLAAEFAKVVKANG